MLKLTRARFKSITAALLALWGLPALAAGGPSFQELVHTPAVQLAYVGAATPEKLRAAMSGLAPLLSNLRLNNPGPGWWGGVTITTPGLGSVTTVISAVDGLEWLSPTLIVAGDDAELGPNGAAVILANRRLRLGGSFETARDFFIGHPDYAPDFVPTGQSVWGLSPDGEFIPLPPPVAGPGWIDTNGYDLKITGVVTSHQRLYKEGVGTLWLTGANVWHAVPTVEAGVLQGDTVSLATDIVNRGRVSFLQAVDGDYVRVISGPGSVHKLGDGTLTLRATQSYTGNTVIEAGRLRLTSGDGLTASSGVQVAAGATLDVSPAREVRLRNLNGAGRVITGAGPLTLVIDRDSLYAGTIEGAGELVVAGSHTLVLTAANTHQGGTRVSHAGWSAPAMPPWGRPMPRSRWKTAGA